MGKGVTIADLEKVMGQKATNVSDYQFDPETGSFGRTITFDLKPDEREKGRIAYHDGKRIMENPYRTNSVQWKRWRLGWLNARKRDHS